MVIGIAKLVIILNTLIQNGKFTQTNMFCVCIMMELKFFIYFCINNNNGSVQIGSLLHQLT